MRYQPLNVLDVHRGVFLTFRDIMAALSPRVADTCWTLGEFTEVDGTKLLEMVVEGSNGLDEDPVINRLPHSQLSEAMKSVRQIIWGTLTGYERTSPTPWIVLSAIDSSFWRIETDDLETRRRIRRKFTHVREGFR